MAFSREINQQIASGLGFQGQAGNGNVDRWLLANPNQIGAYTQARQQYDPNYQFNRQAVAAIQPNFAATGVRPVGVLEPFNAYQKNALTNLAQGPGGMGFMKQAQSALSGIPQYQQQAAQSLTPQAFEQGLGMFMNPYIQQVIDANAGDIRRQLGIGLSDINQEATQAGAFGGSRHAIRQAELERNASQQMADMSARLRASGFSEATGNVLNNLGQERQAALGAGNLGLGMAQGALSGSAQNLQNFYNMQNAALGAGNQIQGQNQKMLDVISGLQQQASPLGRLGTLQGQLGAFPIGGSISPTSWQQPGMLQSAAGGALAGFGLANQFGLGNTGGSSFGTYGPQLPLNYWAG